MDLHKTLSVVLSKMSSSSRIVSLFSYADGHQQSAFYGNQGQGHLLKLYSSNS
jgi:hypothetical protein